MSEFKRNVMLKEGAILRQYQRLFKIIENHSKIETYSLFTRNTPLKLIKCLDPVPGIQFNTF